jgi:hypothetical protein
MGDDSIDWTSLVTTGINDAAATAQVALRPAPPPMYSSVSTPYGTSITSYAPGGVGVNPVTSGLTTLLADPIMVWLGLGLLAFVVMKR